jgi:hypothetical protein
MKITTAVLASILAMSSSMALAQAGGGAGGGAAGGGAATGAAGSAGSTGSASTGSTGSGTSSTTGTNSGESYRNYPGRNAVVDAGTRIDNKQIAGLRWTANRGAPPASGAFLLRRRCVPMTSVFGTSIFGLTDRRRYWVSEPSFRRVFGTPRDTKIDHESDRNPSQLSLSSNS